jgi:outer membrane lipopolysaccharide assembly protein LptE/RlpB
LNWQAAPELPLAENAYLANVVQLAARTDGVALPTVGSAGLHEMRRWASQATQPSRQPAEKPLGRPDEAGLAQHPAEPAAEGSEAAGGDLRLAGPRDGHPDVVPLEADLLNGVERQQRVVEGFLWSEVSDSLTRANSSMTSDPSAAGYQLKVLLDKVQHAADVRPELRAQMIDKIEAGLRLASRASTAKVERDLRQQQAGAAAEARERMTRALAMEEQKVDQLMSRFDSLMAEERYRDAEEVADMAEEFAPALRGAELTARMTGYSAGNNAVRDMTYKGVVDALFQVELSNVPTPDDPPIIYPDPGVWQLLSERRKKYNAVDLSKHGPNEEKILAALDDKTEVDFAEQPLADVVDYLKQRHGFEIQLDKKALTDAGVGSEVPITRTLKGITLRSALKLLLGELELTYVLHNEVLMITSKTEAENMLSQRVYPVADLVIPIAPPRNLSGPAGGGMGGGILGTPGGGYGMGGGMGMGMGMGGMGGGMGGMGGMGGGMGGMGGGMGFF